MNENNSDYKKGLLHFICFMLCICLFFKTPDGDTVFYKFLGLFGISSGIELGNSTLYIYMLLPLIWGILSGKKVFKYWWGYGLRFKNYNVLLRYLPIFIMISILLIPSNFISPSIMDKIYYSVIGQRNGLQAITYYTDTDNLRYEFKGDIWTFFYNLTFKNHGHETVEFNVKLTPYSHDGFEGAFIRDNDGEKKIFTLLPKQSMNYSGECTDYRQTEYDSGGGRGRFSIVLINANEQYTPKAIKR